MAYYGDDNDEEYYYDRLQKSRKLNQMKALSWIGISVATLASLAAVVFVIYKIMGKKSKKIQGHPKNVQTENYHVIANDPEGNVLE